MTMGGGLTAGDRIILTAINTGAPSLSFVGSTFIVLCYCFFKELCKFSFKLVFYLALSDMLCSDDCSCSDPSKGFICDAQGYTTHFFCIASFLWTTTISFTLHRTVVKHKAYVEDLEAMFHLYVWGTFLVVTVIRSFCNNHLHLGPWCWTQTGMKGKAVHFLTFYAPLWGAILYNDFTYFQVIRMPRNDRHAAVPTISLSKTLEEDGSEMVARVAILSHFVFGIVQLCLMSNRVTWRRHKTDNFEPVSACTQWIGLSSNSWDTDLWRRHFGTVIEAHGAVTTEVVLSESHRLLLLFKVWRRSYVNHA
ncbi:hypothetical protein Bca52824_003835 [Brassica carinata]|uniref:G-protein coupled receptors family 2 profile 2 domain-containing protein n=1 Tax=Brassica carinata TaxID=52824 RepID=A0A8X7WPJ2_BRACI|nr:hypothetical protein Bca52824_003835 [Brassica carinata]